MALGLQKRSPTAGLAKGGGKILRVFILTPNQERNRRTAGISMVHPKSDGLPKSIAGLPVKNKTKLFQLIGCSGKSCVFKWKQGFRE